MKPFKGSPNQLTTQKNNYSNIPVVSLCECTLTGLHGSLSRHQYTEQYTHLSV